MLTVHGGVAAQQAAQELGTAGASAAPSAAAAAAAPAETQGPVPIESSRQRPHPERTHRPSHHQKTSLWRRSFDFLAHSFSNLHILDRPLSPDPTHANPGFPLLNMFHHRSVGIGRASLTPLPGRAGRSPDGTIKPCSPQTCLRSGTATGGPGATRMPCTMGSPASSLPPVS